MAKTVFSVVVFLVQVIIQAQLQSLHSLKQVEVVIANILSQYSDYDVIIHFDNITLPETNTLVKNRPNFLQAMLLLNYDKKNRFSRPTGYKFMNIVFLKNSFQFEQFSKISFNLEYYDVILILSCVNIGNRGTDKNGKILHFWRQKGLERAGSIFVLNILTSDLYHECFYCGNMSGVLQKISSGEMNIPLRSYLNDFSNFHGHHFKIGYMSYMPFFWHENTSDDSSIAGPEAKLLKILSTTLNFHYSLENFQDLHFSGEWTAMAEAVYYRKLDWAVGGISASGERSKLADLTKYIHTEMYTALFYCCSSKNTWQSWKQILTPFGITVWLCICSMLVAMTFLLKKASNYFADNSSANISTFFEIAIRGLVDQPLQQIVAKKMVKRFLLIAWWYVAIIITTAYRSKLASSLIHPSYKQQNSIKELLRDDYVFQVSNDDWSVLKENLQASVDHTYNEVLKRSNDNLDICSSVQQAVEHKVAVLAEETNLQYEVITNCSVLLHYEDFSRLRVIGQAAFPSHHVWPLQLAAPYRGKFSMAIENLHSSGILYRWYSLASTKRLPLSNHYNEIESATSLSMSTMYAPILILFVGLILATVSFIGEIAYFTLHYLASFYKSRDSQDLNH